jgi:hypothetical protein
MTAAGRRAALNPAICAPSRCRNTAPAPVSGAIREAWLKAMLLPVTNVTASTSPAQARSDEDLPAKEPQDLDSVLQKLDDLISDRVFGTAQAELDLAFNRFGEQAKLLSRLAALRSEEDLLEAHDVFNEIKSIGGGKP